MNVIFDSWVATGILWIACEAHPVIAVIELAIVTAMAAVFVGSRARSLRLACASVCLSRRGAVGKVLQGLGMLGVFISALPAVVVAWTSEAEGSALDLFAPYIGLLVLSLSHLLAVVVQLLGWEVGTSRSAARFTADSHGERGQEEGE